MQFYIFPFKLKQRRIRPLNNSWMQGTLLSSTRPPWSRTWLNRCRGSLSTPCCSESWSPLPTQTARSTTTSPVGKHMHGSESAHVHTFSMIWFNAHNDQVSNLNQILHVKPWCVACPCRGSEGHGEGGESHQRDAEDLRGFRLRVWPAGCGADGPW